MPTKRSGSVFGFNNVTRPVPFVAKSWGRMTGTKMSRISIYMHYLVHYSLLFFFRNIILYIYVYVCNVTLTCMDHSC